PPNFQGFDILSGPNQSSSFTLSNGKRSQSYGFSYILQPKKTGKYTIGPATIQVAGKTMSTAPFQVEVLKGRNSTASTKQELEQELGKGIFIKAFLNKDASKVGEQIIIDYKLFTSKNIESYNVYTESEYPGFFVYEIRRFNSRQVQEVIDGVQYTTKIIKKIALFPQQSGAFNIDPLSMKISIADGTTRQRSIFSVPKVTTFNIQTDPIEIKVNPLPDPVPSSFTGAVGKFGMRTNINRSQLTTDDAIAIRMYITGDGDIKQVQPPSLEFTDKFKVYEPRLIDESSFEEDGVLKGKKAFEYQVIPLEPGEYTLAPAFSYFDTDSLKFITLSSDSFPITVKKGEIDRTQIIRSGEAVEKPADIRFIKTTTKLSKNNGPFIGSGLFWALFIFPFLLLGGVIIIRQIEAGKGNIDATVLRRRKAVKVAQKRLSQSKSFMTSNDSKAFYDEVSRASFGYVCDKLNIPFSELTKENISTKMKLLEVSDSSIDKFMQIVKTCEMALFAGKDNAAAMKETYGNAIEVIAEIEGEIVRN
ncbi:MAG: hypothetical protein ACI8X3_003040, partial [Saprospiraceae bacterium]